MKAFLILFFLVSLCANAQIEFGTATKHYVWTGQTEQYKVEDEVLWLNASPDLKNALITTQVENCNQVSEWALTFTSSVGLSTSNYAIFHIMADVSDAEVTSSLAVRLAGASAKRMSLCNVKNGKAMACATSVDTLFENPVSIRILIKRTRNSDNTKQWISVYHINDNDTIFDCSTSIIPDDYEQLSQSAIQITYSKTRATGTFSFSDFEVKYGEIEIVEEATPPTPPAPKPVRSNEPISWGEISWAGQTAQYLVEVDSLYLDALDEDIKTATINTTIQNIDSVCEWSFGFATQYALSSSNYALFHLLSHVQDSVVDNSLALRMGHSAKNFQLCTVNNGKITAIKEAGGETFFDKPQNARVVVKRTLNEDNVTQKFSVYSVENTDTIMHCSTDIVPDDYDALHSTALEVYFSKTRAHKAFSFYDFNLKRGAILSSQTDTTSNISKEDTIVNNSPLIFASFTWEGETSQYKKIDDNTLILDASVENKVAQIYTTDLGVDSVNIWRFHVASEEQLSSSNYIIISLISDISEGESATYSLLLRIGGSNKNVALCRKKSTISKISEGVTGSYTYVDTDFEVVRSLNPDGTHHISVYSLVEAQRALECEADIVPDDYSGPNSTTFEIHYSSTRAKGVYSISNFSVEYGQLNMSQNGEQESAHLKEGLCNRGDVVINEIMYRPSGTFGLPDIEWIELYNNTDEVISLNNWTWCSKAKLSNCTILPHGFLVLCSTKNLLVMKNWSESAVSNTSSWVELKDTGKELILEDQYGRVIDYVFYAQENYKDSYKVDGGWSLERKDPLNMTIDEKNWDFSENPAGGTPGGINTMYSDYPDLQQPFSLFVSSADTNGEYIRITFSEPMDTLNIPNQLRINNELQDVSLYECDVRTFSWMIFKLSSPIVRGSFYEIEIDGFYDLAGNPNIQLTEKVGIKEEVKEGDIVINEIMATASPATCDFIEILNVSEKNIDLAELCLATVTEEGSINKLVALTDYERTIFPGEYIVITRNASGVISMFNPQEPNNVVASIYMPALNKNGIIALTDAAGNIIDICSYSEEMYSVALSSTTNVSIERINPTVSSQELSNWTSASPIAGFATPTSYNSQYREITKPVAKEVEITVKVFVPGSNTEPDKALISTVFTDGLWMGTMKVFRADGSLVCVPYNNIPLPSTGQLAWDGYDDSGELQAPGTYIVYISAWQSAGKRHEFKGTVVMHPQK
ncbi:MAG: lamin tail domain-containing protein [Marinilabiliaceae bacterium]|nr:lamin tail domain-containing protein [Marinilabiliaceae bacterium]